MRLTDRILSIHPAAVTSIFVVLFAGGSFATNVFPAGVSTKPISFSISMLVMLGPLMLWHYSLYRAASDRNAQNVNRGGRRAFLFVLAALGVGAFLVLFPLQMLTDPSDPSYRIFATAVPLSMVVGNFSYFASVWAAANALTRFDERKSSTEFHKTLGTFLLEFYLPIGVWVIYPRIKRMLASPVSA